ncbi:MAG: hypothetical protein AABY58_03235 [Nitrospirota bacterium]
MDTERLIRYTIPGWFFIFSLFFHYWAITGEIPCFILNLILCKDSSDAILSFLVALASSPGLGLVTATIGNRILHLLSILSNYLFGSYHPFLFKLPSKEEYNRYFDALWINLPNLRQEVWALESSLRCSENASGINSQHPNYRNNIKELHLLFNLVLRMKSPSDLSKFVLRRWNIFWMHINIISAILLGLFFAFFLRIYFDINKGIFIYAYKFIWQPLFLEIPVIIYLVSAYFHLREARKDAVDIEFKWLLSTSSLSSSTKKRKNHKKNRGRGKR